MNTVIKTIPNGSQRYKTVGDYYNKNGINCIMVSKTGNEDHDFLISLHEFIEWKLTEKRGISEKGITAFDKAFKGDGEPGNSKEAPYHREHVFAENIERQLAAELGVDWEDYAYSVDMTYDS